MAALRACVGLSGRRRLGLAARIHRKECPAMSKSASTSMIWIGVAAIIAGIIALAWPGGTILALVILFAVYAFTDAELQGRPAFTSDTPGTVARPLPLRPTSTPPR